MVQPESWSQTSSNGHRSHEGGEKQPMFHLTETLSVYQPAPPAPHKTRLRYRSEGQEAQNNRSFSSKKTADTNGGQTHKVAPFPSDLQPPNAQSPRRCVWAEVSRMDPSRSVVRMCSFISPGRLTSAPGRRAPPGGLFPYEVTALTDCSCSLSRCSARHPGPA